MFRQWVLILSFAGLVLSSPAQDEASSSTTSAPPAEASSQKPYQPLEAQILQRANGPHASRVYHIVRGDPSVNSASPAPEAKKEENVENHQHVTVHPPSGHRVSHIDVPVYAESGQEHYPSHYIPLDYSQVYESPYQHPYVNVQPNAYLGSELEARPSPAPGDYHHNVLYVPYPTEIAPPHNIIQSHRLVNAHHPTAHSYPIPSSLNLYPSYQHHLQPIVHRVEDQHVSISHPGHFYETATARPSSGAYVLATASPSPLPVQHVPVNVTPQPVQYVLSPPRVVKKIVKKPIKNEAIESHKSYVAHPSAPHYNLQIVPHHQSVPLYNHQVSYPTSPVGHNLLSLNHHGIPHMNYALSSPGSRAIPVPVIFNTEHEHSHRYVAQPIPVPVAYRNSQDNARDEEKERQEDSARSSHHQNHDNYSRVHVYSPSADVSRVKFSSNGIDYEW